MSLSSGMIFWFSTSTIRHNNTHASKNFFFFQKIFSSLKNKSRICLSSKNNAIFEKRQKIKAIPKVQDDFLHFLRYLRYFLLLLLVLF